LYLNLTILTTAARKTWLCELKNCILLIPQGYFSMVETERMGKGDINSCNKSVLRGKGEAQKMESTP